MRLHFVNRFYWPAETATAQLLTDLAESLAARGWLVSVYTGHSDAGLPATERHHGVDIRRIGRRMANGQRLGRRAFDFAAFHLALLPALGRAVVAGDIIISLTDPPFAGITSALIAAARGAHLVHWVQDIYPEILPAVSRTRAARVLCAGLRPPRDLAWRRAATCVTLSQAMVAHLQQSGVPAEKTQLIANWAPRGVEPVGGAAVRRLRDQWDLGDRYVVAYSGNFGRVHDLSNILDVAAALRANPRIVFLFIGSGAAFASLRRDSEARGLANVRFQPPQPRRDLAVSLAVADLHLVSLRHGCEGLVFPSKLYGIAAAGRPVLLLANPASELAQLTRRENLGVVFRPDDAGGIAEELARLALDPARHERWRNSALAFTAAAGGCAAAVERWDLILRALGGAGAIAPRDTPAPEEASRP